MVPDKPSHYQSILFIEEGDRDPRTRRLIKSHVMLGKNRRAKKAHKSRRAGAVAKVAAHGIPPKISCSAPWGALTNDSHIDPQVVVDVIQCASAIGKARYLLGTCLPFLPLDRSYIESLWQDPSLFQTAVMMAETYFQFMRGEKDRCRSLMQVSKTIQILRKKLSLADESEQISNQTLFVVGCLASYARVLGDDDAVRQHLEGIRRIIGLRGGMEKLAETKLFVELLRCDLGLALHTGTKPLLMGRDQRFSAHPLYHDTLVTDTEAFLNLDGRVAQAWKLMARFCSLVNLATEAHGLIPWDLFLHTITSVISPLQGIGFIAESFDEVVRLALLVVSSHVLLQWNSIKVPFDHLRTAYRDAILHSGALHSATSQTRSWFLMIGAVTVFAEADNHWLRPRLKAQLKNTGIESWAEMRKILNSFLWVNVLLESPGRKIICSLLEGDDS